MDDSEWGGKKGPSAESESAAACHPLACKQVNLLLTQAAFPCCCSAEGNTTYDGFFDKGIA